MPAIVILRSDQVSEYAQKLISSAGQKDGLYWETVADDEPSPLGPLFALARKEGYTRKAQAASQSAAPFHGYYFKILTRQRKRSGRCIQLHHQRRPPRRMVRFEALVYSQKISRSEMT